MAGIHSSPSDLSFIADRYFPNGVSEMPSSWAMDRIMSPCSDIPFLRYSSLSEVSRYPSRYSASGNVADSSSSLLLAVRSSLTALMNSVRMDCLSFLRCSSSLSSSSALAESFFLTRSFSPSSTIFSSGPEAKTSMRGSSPPISSMRILK